MKKGINLGEKNGMWVGDRVKYAGLHAWVRAHKPKSVKCENCKEAEPLDLANVSGKYKRDINDFKWLCRKCHMLEDSRLDSFKKMSKEPRYGRNNPNWRGGLPKCKFCGKVLSKNTSVFCRKHAQMNRYGTLDWKMSELEK